MVLELLVTALVGGLAAIAVIAIFDPAQLTVDLDGLVFAAGALFAVAVHQAFTWRKK